MIELSGAQAIVRALRAEQVQHVFGVVGGKLAPLIHAIANEPTLRYTGLRHESSGPMMAAAVNAACGRVAVAIGEMGPGSLNLAAGLGGAANNNLPVLAITTNQHRAASYPHSGMFMDLDSKAVFAPLTRWNAVVQDPRRIPELVRTAFRAALGPRPGPVHLDVPQDVLSARVSFADDEFDAPASRYRAVVGPRPAPQLVTEAVRLLREARAPLIVAGGGVVASGAQTGVLALAQVLRAPIVATQMALGVVPTDSERFIGHGGLISGAAVKEAFASADLVLSIGCRFSSWMWDQHGPLVRREQALININTDPAALGHPALHSLAMQADATLAVDDLLQTLGNNPSVACDAQWLTQLRAVRIEYERALDEQASAPLSENQAMHPAALARAIGQALPRNCLAAFDGGHTTFWSNDLTPVHNTRTHFHEPGMSQLGFGLPYALALKLVHPSRPVFNVTGDGSFGFTLNELDTARRAQLPVVTIIHNNASWGIIRAGQRRAYDFEHGTSLDGTDYAAIAKGFGCYGERVTTPEQVAPAIERALASNLPAVLDCLTRFTPHPAGPQFGSMNNFGFDALTRAG